MPALRGAEIIESRFTTGEAGLERFRSWVACFALLLLGDSISLGMARGLGFGRGVGLAQAAKVDFNREVRPILAKNCFACHGQDEAKRAKGLRLDLRESAIKPLKSGEKAIVPGDPDSSELIVRITEEDETLRMPPKKTGDRLSSGRDRCLDTLGRARGRLRLALGLGRPQVSAAARGPKPRHGPETASTSGSSPGWRKRGSSRRRRPTAIRSCAGSAWISAAFRPRPREVDRFIQDPAADAYEQAVDRLLDDPAYGERWARMWLDLARYADSAGYGSDPLRPNIWRYPRLGHQRLQPQPTLRPVHHRSRSPATCCPTPPWSERMATAFHRNTMTNTEGGTDDEEFRVAAIKDRVDTTMQVWMGLTIGCAKCHSHKFDPITQEEYYRFYALFNQTADNDQPDESPVIPAPTPEITERVRADRRPDRRAAGSNSNMPSAALAAAQAKWESSLALPNASRRKDLPKEILTIIDTAADKRTKVQTEALATVFPFDRAGVEAAPRRDRRAREIQARRFPPCR